MIPVAVTGSLGFDYIMDFSGRFADRIMPDKIHKLSLSFLADKLTRNFGGTAGNIAYSLKLLGLEPYVVAPAGNDFAPYGEFLDGKGISRTYIREYGDEPTGSYFVITDSEDNQIGSFYAGALKHAAEVGLPDGKTGAKCTFTVISPNAPDAMNAYVKACAETGMPYLYDPAFQIGSFSPEDLKTGITHAAVLIGNDYEISLMEQKLGVDHKSLLSMVPTVVTTLGSRGSTVETGGKRYDIPVARPHSVLDPTGAGDAYRGGFLSGYLRGLDPETCGKLGAVSSVYTVEAYGTQTHTYTKAEFIARYRDNFGGEPEL